MRSPVWRRILPDTEICARARGLIQNRQLELATFSRIHHDEIAEVEAALRDLWVIKQKNKKASSCKPTLAQKTRKDGAPGQGAQQKVQDQIASMGTNLIYVSAGSVNRGGTHLGAGATKTLTDDDMKAIVREVPTVSAAAPGAGASAQVVYGNQNWSTRVNGTEPQYFAIRDWQVASGSSFTDDDVSHSANVAVLGANLGHPAYI